VHISEGEWSEAVFGGLDGLVSVTGVIFALLARGEQAIILAAVGLAVASAIGMGAGQWLSDSRPDGAQRRALVMAAATVTGTVTPVIPFIFLPQTAALIVAGLLTVMMGAAISHVRGRRWKGYAQTFTILVAAAGVTVAVSVAIPGG
jgi:VIT1/CCC1 family predicted Fe2+/Mn2+ transporter